MKKYRLKKEAVPFILEKHAESIYTLDSWEKNYGICENALEEVKPVYISYGHTSFNKAYNSTSLSGWDDKKGSHFHFTINFPSIDFMENDKLSKGRIVRNMMDKIQLEIDIFYEQFHNREI